MTVRAIGGSELERIPDTKTDRFADFRALFPGAEQGVFMNVAQRGLMPTPVREAIERYLDGRTGLGWTKHDSFDLAEVTRETFARLINASPDEIAFTKNVSDGLNMIAGGVRWESGDNIVLCPELDHPANVYPWYNVARREAVEIRAVEALDEGTIEPGSLVRAMDDRTKIVAVPTVSFSPGFVTDLGPLADACAAGGARLVVDAAQSVGILHTDAEEMGIDALAVATQKGLLACYGQGFLYCRRDFAEEMLPAALARFGVDHAEGAHETEITGESFAYAKAARRFDGGNFNYLGLTAALESMRLLEPIGTQVIESYVRPLAARLARGLLELGLPVCGGEPGDRLGNIVAVGTSGGGRHYTADDPAMNALNDALTAEGVHLSIRRGVLRLSLHAYNNETDVDRVVEIAAQPR